MIPRTRNVILRMPIWRVFLYVDRISMARPSAFSHVCRNDTRSQPGGDFDIPVTALSPPFAPARRPIMTFLQARLNLLPRTLIPLAIVIATYVLGALFIPTMAPVAISDDWTYTRSVEYLVRQGRFHILPVAAATMVFQLFWGRAFALVFGMSFGALRLSTVVITLLGGIAFFGMCRELGVKRNRSALGTAVYLFN